MTHIYSESNFNKVEKEYKLSFERTDRNGTKYFTGVQKCWKCLGNQVFDCWGHIANGVCFACNGTGVNPCKVKVMTDEHYNELEKKRTKRIESKMKEQKAHALEKSTEFLARNGFNADGKAWLVVKTGFVEKSYTEEILSKGAKKYSFNIYIFNESRTDYDCIEVNAKDCLIADMYGVYNDFNYHFMNQLLADVQEKERQEVADKSLYFGTVGEKLINLEVTFKNIFFYDTQFGSLAIYIFEDTDGHQFKWKTSKGFSNIEKGDFIKINGTIKEYSEYNGVKQTVLTRCKIA